MSYLKSEHLKFKRTISNKLLFIIPLKLTTGGLLLTLLWFSHWEGRKNDE